MNNCLRALVLGAFLTILGAARAQDIFADQVVGYDPGSGINQNYQTASVALGAPAAAATITAPAFLPSDIVGIGMGGELTLSFSTPITNDPINHAGGMDFTIFGNDFFVLSGSTIRGIFNHPGLSVWVSEDNLTYYQLAAPYGADEYYPTQGNGDPSLPVNSTLSLSNFTGDTTAQALSLYNGSAGGASYSIGWAEDAGGNHVDLPSISYVMVQAGPSAVGEVDAISRVEDVPEPAGASLAVVGCALLMGLSRFSVVSSRASVPRQSFSQQENNEKVA